MSFIISTVLIIFWFIVILIPIVAIHEMGHFLFSKLMGVKVLEYGIGIPPRAFARRWKKVIWSLNWLPLGGFAKIYGDHDALDAAEDIVASDPDKAREVYREARISEIVSSRDLCYFLEDNNLEYTEEWKTFETYTGDLAADTAMQSLYKQLATLVDWEYDEVINTKEAFCNVSWWRQSFILLGGVTFNLITAVVILFILFGFVGTPAFTVLADDLADIRTNANVFYTSEYIKVLRVEKDSPAQKAGLEPKDDLISFNNVQLNTIQNFDEFATLVQSQTDATVTIVYRDAETGITEEKQVDLEQKDGRYFFGLRSTDLGYLVRYKSNNLGDAAASAVGRTADVFVLNFKVLGDVVVALMPWEEDRAALQQVAGPIAIGSFGSFIFNIQGVAGILNIMALVSIGLAAFNLLPIPALDGGRFVIVTLNAITRKRNKRLEGIVITITFLAMLLMAGVIAFFDIFRTATGGFGF